VRNVYDLALIFKHRWFSEDDAVAVDGGSGDLKENWRECLGSDGYIGLEHMRTQISTLLPYEHAELFSTFTNLREI
jgi:hypothetical protein